MILVGKALIRTSLTSLNQSLNDGIMTLSKEFLKDSPIIRQGQVSRRFQGCT